MNWVVGISAIVVLAALMAWIGFFVGCMMAVRYYEDEKLQEQQTDPEARLRAITLELTRSMPEERCRAFAADVAAIWPQAENGELQPDAKVLSQTNEWQAWQRRRGN